MLNKEIRNYTKALYEISILNKSNNVSKNYAELSLAIIDFSNIEPKLFKYLGSSNVSRENKFELIKLICDNNIFYLNWLSILIEDGKSWDLRSYIEDFIDLYRKKNNILKAQIWTTEILGQDHIQKLQKALKVKLKKEIIVQNKIDKEIIGGIKVEANDYVWDNTIKNQLNKLLKEVRK